MIFNFEHGSLPGSLELAYLGDTLYDLYVREHLVAGGGSTPFCCAEARVVKASSAHANRILKYVFIVWIFILKEVTTQNFTAPRGVNRFAMLYQKFY